MKKLLVFAFVCALISCASPPKHSPAKKVTPPARKATVESSTTTLTPATTKTASTTPAAASQPINLYSPYSTEGLLALNAFRSNNSALNDFLVRNRKPDYFFSGINTDYSYQKIYLVYLESENLYLFDTKLTEPYKKFHPLPESVRENFKNVMPIKPSMPGAPAVTTAPPQNTYTPVAPAQNSLNNISEIDNRHTIENTLAIKRPVPYLDTSLLYAIPHEGMDSNSSPIYPDLYFLDMPLSDLLENQYSAKYDSKKHLLKLIFPKSYESGLLYKKAETETRKIFVEHNIDSGSELSLVVPDFLPGSDFYRTTRGNISKVFASLYQVNVPVDFVDSNQLHMRYSIKLCQGDVLGYCAVKRNNATYVRAIVIEATLYDNQTKAAIDTIVLK